MSEKLTKSGLRLVWSKIVANFVAKESGKGLSTNDFSDAFKTKLESIAENAQVNVVESIKVNGVAQTVTNKAVNISVPTGELASKDNVSVGDLASDVTELINNKVTKEAGMGLSKNNYDDAAVAEVAKVAGKADKATTLAGYGIDNAYTKTEVDDVIKGIRTDIASVYKVKGSIAFAELPSAGMAVGDVYNVTDGFTASDAFVTNDQGKEYPAGTNVVYTEDGWDCMAGTFDFSGFATKAELPIDITEADINEICVLS